MTCLTTLLQVMTSADDVGGSSLSVLLVPVAASQDGGRYLCSAELEGNTVTAEAYVDVIGVLWHLVPDVWHDMLMYCGIMTCGMMC